MTGRARVALVGLVVLALVTYGVVHLLSERVLPPVVERRADARELLEPSFVARVGRALRERFPPAVSHRTRLVALTFDDGPYPVDTPLLLDELGALHVPGTFFLIGDDVRLFPALARRIAAGGDEIANHTQTHPANFDALSSGAVKRELDDGAATLLRYVHDPAIRTTMRPPHGRFTLETLEAAQRDGYRIVLWSDDAGDWRAKATPAVIAAHVTRYATAPDIVLLHSGKMNTIEALPAVVGRFQAAGFRFVTVGTLLHAVPQAHILNPVRTRV